MFVKIPVRVVPDTPRFAAPFLFVRATFFFAKAIGVIAFIVLGGVGAGFFTKAIGVVAFFVGFGASARVWFINFRTCPVAATYQGG
jgi:hypothetical protein